MGTGLGEVAGEQPQQLFQITAQCGVEPHLHAQVFEHRHAVGGPDHARRGPQLRFINAARSGVLTHRHILQRAEHVIHTIGMVGQPGGVVQLLLGNDCSKSRQTPCIGARSYS